MNAPSSRPEVIQVPEYYYAVDINYLTHMIADMLGRLISHNDLIPLTPSNLTRFHSRTPPNISLSDYLRRIVKYTSVEKSCLLILLIYIDRVCELHPHFTVSSLTVHRFLITAVTVSSKALCDSYCTNSHYAKVGGISTQEINALELEFLALIDWHLASTGPILQQYYANLVEQHPCYERIIADPMSTHRSLLKRRRRSSTESALSQKSSTGGDKEGREMVKGVEEKHSRSESTEFEEMKIEEERTKKHFDTLLEDDTIPYIA
ncbi:cyclin-domain-containing protein [Mycotypha africana]|uniref:cyclin-domain-containing protein n=1 Tax=Mycotypha africana TaxID=64632 RepID=UPI002300512A|nr:cyclin-domain-containing protein [Mycotypha africana]KAI8987478.1 cyclin-domain-containing protein [Mycotypha africana]